MFSIIHPDRLRDRSVVEGDLLRSHLITCRKGQVGLLGAETEIEMIFIAPFDQSPVETDPDELRRAGCNSEVADDSRSDCGTVFGDRPMQFDPFRRNKIVVVRHGERPFVDIDVLHVEILEHLLHLVDLGLYRPVGVDQPIVRIGAVAVIDDVPVLPAAVVLRPQSQIKPPCIRSYE